MEVSGLKGETGGKLSFLFQVVMFAACVCVGIGAVI